MTPSIQPITLYQFPLSGHSHRVRLFLSLLKLPCTLVNVDLRAGEHKGPAFLALNPFGQVPVIRDGDFTLADSNAILVYLACRYDHTNRWLPAESKRRAQVQQWLSVAAGPLWTGAAAARRVKVFGAKLDHAEAKASAHQLLGVIEQHLSKQPFLVGDESTIADIAIYSYTAHVPEGDVDLAPYPNIRAWLSRIEALPGFVRMQPAPAK